MIVLPEGGRSETLAKGGGEPTGVDGFDEYVVPLSVEYIWGQKHEVKNLFTGR